MSSSLKERAKRDRIRELNDQFRTTLAGGRVVYSLGVEALAPDMKATVMRKVATFADFNRANDPNGEHDFGRFELAGRKFFWKIDYYDQTLAFGADDPSDPEQTTRVLTIMFAEEY